MTDKTNGVDHVVYSVSADDRPAIRYRALPSGCAGAAATMDEARASYRAQLSALLRVDRRRLPPVVEHIEGRVHGMRVREQMGTVHRDHYADRMLLQTLLAGASTQDQLRDYVAHVADRGSDPVVALMEPEDPVAAVLDQMTPQDIVVVTHSDRESELGWAVICGSEMNGDNAIPGITDIPDVMTLRKLRADEFTSRFAARAVRVRPKGLARAS